MLSNRELKVVVESWIEEVKDWKHESKTLGDSLKYVLSTGGKRLRPIIILTISQNLGVNIDLLKNTALAVELFHIATLIHDDLPGLDNDDFRRGEPTVHKKFSVGTAVLLGDYLQGLSVRLLSEQKWAKPETLLKIITKFSYLNEIISEGQIMDLDYNQSSENNPSNSSQLATIEAVNSKKTAKFFEFCITCPYHLFYDDISKQRSSSSGITSEDKLLEDLQDFGMKFGRYFQLLDDIADFKNEDKNSLLMMRISKTKMLEELKSRISVIDGKYLEPLKEILEGLS